MCNVNLKTFFIATAVLLGSYDAALANELIIPVGQQAPEKQSVQRPQNGIDKGQVEQQFGAPEVKNPAIGDPPISSWEYPDYIVYFEHDRVLHSVLKRNGGDDNTTE